MHRCAVGDDATERRKKEGKKQGRRCFRSQRWVADGWNCSRKGQNAPNSTERLLPAEHRFSSTGRASHFFSFSVLFGLLISAFRPLKQYVSGQPTGYVALYYQTSIVNKDLASDFQMQQGLWLENFKSSKNPSKNTLLSRFIFQLSRCPKTQLSLSEID